jgi:hypothetical protein
VIRAFTFVVLFSVAMTIAMVQFNSALVFDDPRRAEHRSLWGALYVALWGGICYALWDLIRQDRALMTTDWTALALAPVGWFTFNALWLAAWGAIEVRNAAAAGNPPPQRAATCRRLGWQLARIGLGITLVLAAVMGAPQAVAESIHPLANLRLTLVVSMLVTGWLLLMWGGVRLALGTGRAKKRNDGSLGVSNSAEGEIVVTFSELADAWRRRLWINDARWRTVYMMVAGGVLVFYGGFGLAIVLGPWPVALLCSGAVVYATVRTVQGFLKE